MNSIVAGIDIGGTNTVIGLVTKDGVCLKEITFPTQKHRDFYSYISQVASEIKGLLKGIEHEHSLVGIGVGAPNGSYITGEIIDAANLRWKGVLPIKKDLHSHFKLPVELTNDANAAALGEKLFGAAKQMKNFVFITLGTGLGSGIVVDGKLVLGHDGFAGELGHISVKTNGRLCGCGKKGCLETYVSASGLRRTTLKLLANSNKPSALRDFTFNSLTAKQIADFALKGDKVALEAFRYTGEILGLKLADVVATLSPEAIFLFGGLSNAGDLIFSPTKQSMEANLFSVFRNKVDILPSGLKGKNVAVLGAAALIWQNYTD
jgi:glucokinase